jgi:FkbM family methyltransferase
MRSFSNWLRNHWHPLHALRRKSWGRWLLKSLDRPVWRELPHIGFPVRVMVLRNSAIIADATNLHVELLDFLADRFRPASFWDVGANVGYCTWLLKSKLPDLEAVLFEPDPINVRLLHETITNSRLSGLEVLPIAASDTIGETAFKVDRFGSATGSIVNDTTSNDLMYQVVSESVTVPTLPLDDIFVRKGIGPALVKIDVEGAEQLVFEGARNFIRTCKPIILFEVRSALQPPIFAFLKSESYSLLDAATFEEPTEASWDVLAVPGRLQELVDAVRSQFCAPEHR